jgi:polysaccharide biosynthesis protein PslH
VNSVVVTRYRPNSGTSGAALRVWQNIRALGSLGPVDVVTVGVDDTAGPVEGVREWAPFSVADRSRWERIWTSCSPLRPGIYPGIDLYHFGRVTSWLRERALQRRYDLAVIETTSLAAYLPDLKRVADCVAFDAHNVESVLHAALGVALAGSKPRIGRRFKNWVLNRRMAAAEKRVILGADLVWVCSNADAAAISRLYGRRIGVTVVPNGVDVEAYRHAGAPAPCGDWSRLPIRMVYPGLFTYVPNEDAALRLIQEVFPAVRAYRSDARVVLVGRDPTPTLVELARRTPGVEITGHVESIVPHLEEPCVVTLPIALGSGTRLKILEAFAVGRPVVSTAKGAEGIEALDGRHLLIREDPQSIANAVVELWTRPSLRAGLCEDALDLVRTKYSWSSAAQMIAQSLQLDPNRSHLQPDSVAERGHAGRSTKSVVCCAAEPKG